MTISLTNLQQKILFLCLALATFMMVLDYSIANVSIPYISGDLGASVDEGTYVITSFAVGNAIGLSMTGGSPNGWEKFGSSSSRSPCSPFSRGSAALR